MVRKGFFKPNIRITSFLILTSISLSVFYHFTIAHIVVENAIVMVVVLSCLASFLFRPKIWFGNSSVTLVRAFLCYSLITSIWSPGSTITNLKVIITALVLFLYRTNQEDSIYIYYCSLISSIIIIFLLMIKGDYYLGGIRYSIVLSDGSIMEQNSFFGFCFFTFSIIISYILSGNTNKTERMLTKAVKYSLSFCYIVVFLYYILITSSRGSLVTCFFMFFTGVVLYRKNYGKSVLVIMISVLILSYIIFNTLSSDLLNRLDISFIRQTGAANRFDIWKNMIQYFNNRSIFANLFGDGVCSVKIQMGRTSHNVFIECFSEYGLIGFALFLAIHISILINCIKSKNNTTIIFYIGVLIWGMSIALNNELLYWGILYFISELNIHNIRQREHCFYE